MAAGTIHTSRQSPKQFFGHPRGLSTLFFTELWERFSYYGMRAILILFMTASVAHGGLGFPVSQAGAIYGLYTAMVFLTPLAGGWIADRLIGQRRSVLYGGIVIAAGHFSMAVPTLPMFYLGLTLIVLGTGLLKPNVSTMVGQLYSDNDHRRDAGFSIFYMGINLGAFFAPLACGWIGERVNWHYGFALAGAGMILGLLQYVLGAQNLGGVGLYPADPVRLGRKAVLICAAAFAALGVIAASFSAVQIADLGGFFLVAVTVGFFIWLFAGHQWPPVERRRLLAVAVLFVAACLFWANYEQAGSTLSLFAERNTRLTLLGFHYPASWFQSMNPLFIFALAPVFAWLWVRLGSREPSSPAKFAWGLVFVGLGFAILIPVAGSSARVSAGWLTATYFLQTIGELLLSPVGLSAMTKLAPVRVASMTMGVWFLADSIGNYIGGRLAGVYETFPLPMLFGLVGFSTLALGVIMMLLVKPVEKLMGGVR